MTGPQPTPISPAALFATFGTAAAPLMVDVRRGPAFDADDTLIAGALRRLPEETGAWVRDLPSGRPVVAYCVHGHEVSQSAAAALAAAGRDASYLDGGITAWRAQGLPTRRKWAGAPGPATTMWVTRERPKVDR